MSPTYPQMVLETHTSTDENGDWVDVWKLLVQSWRLLLSIKLHKGCNVAQATSDRRLRKQERRSLSSLFILLCFITS